MVRPDFVTVFVDGCFLNGKYSGSFVVFDKDRLIYQDCGVGIEEPELLKLRNIAGEMSAAMHAAYWIDANVGRGIIVHDYVGLSKWVTGEWETHNKNFFQNYLFLQKSLFNFKLK